MITEVTKGVIAVLIILGIIWAPGIREYLVPALTFILGYYFADNKVGILRAFGVKVK